MQPLEMPKANKPPAQMNFNKVSLSKTPYITLWVIFEFLLWSGEVIQGPYINNMVVILLSYYY